MRERSKVKLLLAAAMAALVCCAVGAAPAAANHGQTMISSFSPIASYSDARGDMPARPGSLVKARYGPYTVAANSQLHNRIDEVQAPCSNCYITDMVPSLLNGTTSAPGSTVQNLDSGGMMHHFLLHNFGPGKPDSTCQGVGPGVLGERFFASGNERTHTHLPNGFGYQQGTNTWFLTSHLVNKSASSKTFWFEITFRYVTTPLTSVRALWLDIDGMGDACGDSEYIIPTGYSDTHQSWTVPAGFSGRLVSLAGHLHDVDVTGPGSCTTHCPEKGHGIAISAELVGGSASEYYGPNPPTSNGTPTSPPSDLTGATICRSEGYYGTPFGGTQFAGHLDTVSSCGVNTDLPAGAQALAYPAGGKWQPPNDGYEISPGDVIRLHAEYQNDTGSQQGDAMGIMIGYLAPPEPGYARPKAASPTLTSFVQAYNTCATNRQHGGALSYPSCNPPVPSSPNVTSGTPDTANQTPAAASFVGSAKFVAVAGNGATTADEADLTVNISLTDVRSTASGLPDYTGQLQLRSAIEATDRNNGPGEVGVGQSTDIAITIPCASTISTTVGSTCSINTSLDAVYGGQAIREGRRSTMEMGEVRIFDGGADGNVSTAPNSLFATQGIFVP